MFFARLCKIICGYEKVSFKKILKNINGLYCGTFDMALKTFEILQILNRVVL